MKSFVLRMVAFFEIPLDIRSRVLLIAAALMLLPSLMLPLWKMQFYSNQFPEGLELRIYASKLEGTVTHNRDDLKEINALNKYIGMRPLKDENFTEFKWIPFVLGGLILLALRVAVLGKMSKLVDLLMLFVYFSIFSLWSFYDKLHTYGHVLDSSAPIKVDPFTPPMFGIHTVANFDIYSFPDLGSFFMGAVPLLLFAAIWLSLKSNEIGNHG